LPLNLPFRPAPARPLALGALFAALACGLLLCAGPVRAAYMIPGGAIRPKDFSLVKKDGYYHLFFIRNNTTLPADLTETDFGHAISTDLYHWTQQPVAFAVDRGEWDNWHLWAPSVFEYQGLYWMFYTGVTYWPGEFERTQRIGLAVSSDLVTWNRYYDPVFDASQVNWTWSDPLNSLPAFRDAFVMPDPRAPGSWLMYYTASLAADTAATVVGVAASTGDFHAWQDVKPLLITWRNYTYNILTESPHVFEHDGLWYLFISTTSGQPLSFYTSPDPTGEPYQWTYRGRLRNMLGFDTTTWFASEYFRDGTHEFFTCVNGDRVEIREMAWNGWQFSLLQPPLQHVVRMGWSVPQVASGAQATLKTVIANPLAGELQFQVLAVDSSGFETVVPPESVGFTPSPSVWADTSYISWVPRRWPAVPDSDTVTVTRFRVRCSDLTAQSDLLTVGHPIAPAPPAPADTLPPDPSLPGDPIEVLPAMRLLRSLSGTPAGTGPALAVELPAAAPARVDVFDLSGRRVRSLARRDLPAGVTVLPWDGRDDAGVRMPRGLYFARLVTPSRTATARVLLVPR
jgi:hypothetical protein